MNRGRHAIVPAIVLLAGHLPAWCQKSEQKTRQPETIASALNHTWKMLEYQFVAAAEAMPEEKYSFRPTNGEFKRVRSFAQQVKHVACANFTFFREIQHETPPADCLNGGPDPAKTKAELMKYLRDSFAYADRVIPTINTKNALDSVSGPYAAPSSRLGLAVVAVWHVSDHYGQIVEYLRMNGIVPPASQGAPQPKAP